MHVQFDPKTFLAGLPNKPGVYCMFDQHHRILYVGKARHLKKRLSSYFTQGTLSQKTQALVARIAHIEITLTHTESEALLLENTLIKTHQPRYNILLRDDKSYPYPYLYLSAHSFPRLSVYRGEKRGPGHYFGPYPHTIAVYKSLKLIQKLFLIRSCQDNFFSHRSRPCLQYQIRLCSAPCVGFIDETSYQNEVHYAVLFLKGKNQEVMERFIEKMHAAAKALEYEQAAQYRDQISDLREVQVHASISQKKDKIDIIVGIVQEGMGCIQLMTIRDGLHQGNRAFFLQFKQDVSTKDLLVAFLGQYYLNSEHELPGEIILNEEIDETHMFLEAIKQQRGQKVQIRSRVRGVRMQWLNMAIENAQMSLAQRRPHHYQERLVALTTFLNRSSLPQRIECFDISHTSGEATVAVCVVFDSQGACKQAYRRFNIEGIVLGDDYAALHQALTRYYRRIASPPDILLIDGGLNQVKVAEQVFDELQWSPPQMIGIAKGPGRKAGLETLILTKHMPLRLPSTSPVLHLLQYIRDEAHRVAITAHRRRRTQRRRTSLLEHIQGIGPMRRQKLLSHFGGLQGIAKAGVEDLASVPGINRQLAQKIYEFFLADGSLKTTHSRSK